MFIQTEATPNPSTLKFLPGFEVSPEAPLDFQTLEQARISPLASRLLKLNGVEAIFLGPDFVTVTKGDVDWQHIKPAILGCIMEHSVSGEPIVHSNAVQDDEEHFDPADQEIVDNIKELLDSRVRPAVEADGGDIRFHRYHDGIVFLSMRGACAGCPASTATLKHGIENLLRHFIPEVLEVRASV